MPPLSQTEIEDTIRRILIADLAVDPALLNGIDATTPLIGGGLGLDSVETVGLALGLERAFAIQIPDGDLTVETFENLGELVNYVSRQVGAQRIGQAGGRGGDDR